MNISRNGYERTYADRPVAAEQQAKAVRNDYIPSEINSTKAMHLAELRGRTFSIGEEQLVKAIEKANKALSGKYTTFEFSIHEETKEIMVKVLDKESGELIREIPNEKVLDMVAKLWELSGILIDEKR